MAEENLNFPISIPRPRFSVAMLFGLISLCVVLLAWYMDRNQLKDQIPSPVERTTVLFRLQTSSCEVVAAELRKLFPSETFVSEKGSNSVISSHERSKEEVLRLVILYMDRQGTEYVKNNADPTTNLLLPPQLAGPKSKSE